MIKKNYIITKDDLVAYYRVAVVKGNTIPCIFIIVLSISHLISKVTDTSVGVNIFIVILMLLAATYALIKSPYAIAEKVLKQTVAFQHDIFVEFSEQGFKQEVYNSNSFLKWSDAFKYFESKKTFAIFLTEQQVYIIPKRFFTTDEIAAISKLLKDNVISKDDSNKKLLMKIAPYLILFVVLMIIIFLLLE